MTNQVTQVENGHALTINQNNTMLIEGVPAFSVMPGLKMDSIDIINAISEGEKLDKHREKVVHITGFTLTHGTYARNEYEEPKPVVHLTFLTQEGVGIHTMSSPVLSWLKMVVSALGTPSQWKNPLKVEFSKKEDGYKSFNKVRIIK